MAFQKLSLSGYNRASEWQLVTQLKKLPLFLEHFLPLSSSPHPHLQLIDYGCSEGHNSITFFKSAFQHFRQHSPKPISILHTDLPSNNWQEFNSSILNAPTSYISLENIYYSTLGRSFFNQLVPDNSVHLGFSAFAFHYLSKVPVRKPGENTLFHSGYFEQGLSDMETILRLRTRELVIGGKLFVLIGRRPKEANAKIGALWGGAFKALIEQRLISEEEFLGMEMNVYSLSDEEWSLVMEKFKGTLELKRIEPIRSGCPSYLRFLEDGDLKRYKNELANFVIQILVVQIKSFIKRDESEHERLLGVCREYLMNTVERDPSEYYMDFNALVMEKIGNA